MADNVISISLKRTLPDLDIDVNIKVPARGLTAVFGRSGSGKTTLINMLSGLMDPDSGTIDIGGETLFDSAKRINVAVHRRRIGYVFQEARLFPHLTVNSNLRFGHRESGQIKFDQVVELLGIGHVLGRRPHHLSGGEKQRVAIGRALLSNPRVLLMDEPLSALDESRKNEIMPFLRKIRDEIETPIFYITHSKSEVEMLANTVVLLARGKVVETGNVDQVWPALNQMLSVREPQSSEFAL